MARATRTKRKRDDDDDDGRSPKLSKRDDDHPPPTLATDDADAILAVLDMTDTQGLLDRVFPVSGQSSSASLRALLAAAEPLAVLRHAVQQLLPISSAPRAAPSATAVQQHRFCRLALSLLDQASTHHVDLTLQSILPAPPRPAEPRPLKYALVQHLPQQDYWTSLNADSSVIDALKTLPTAHAELVAILPTPAPATTKKPVPTLAAYAPSRLFPSVKPLPAQRSVSTGAFLDYGPYTSFAPSFDHAGEVVPRHQLGFVLYAAHHKRRRRQAALAEAREGRGSIHDLPETDSQPDTDVDQALAELLPPEAAAAVKSTLASLELESAVHELLARNRRALVRLEQLQITRLAAEGEHSTAEEGSEEWDLGTSPRACFLSADPPADMTAIPPPAAQGIMDTLAVLASLRPRAAHAESKDSNPTSILPPPGILHKLHRTLALAPTPGWYGTLPASTQTTRPAALRDDTTVKKSRSAPAAATPAPTTAATAVPVTTPAPAAAVPTTISTPVTMPYSGYTYAYGQAQAQAQAQAYKPTATATTNGTAQAQTQYAAYTPQYYAYAPPAQQAGGAPGVVQQQSYYGAGAVQQQGYAAAAYSGWYNAYQQQQQQAQAQGGSGHATPQPQTPAPATTYGSFFGGAARTPAVANTVYAPQVQAQAQQPGVGAGVGPMPPHLRAAGAQGVGGGGGVVGPQQQAYYAQAQAYQQGK
ncbi:hypothetical protein H0H81_005141 [Sphagnurus paluster]|uniref:Uncharacterized protein n=1 Tax=Sphagnurus paluster TaxID=117069 RepID=A0A9P7GWG3_9AGAR|nr:hypothetical protein H0H81_005141 [Sphagnurus paluster]